MGSLCPGPARRPPGRSSDEALFCWRPRRHSKEFAGRKFAFEARKVVALAMELLVRKAIERKQETCRTIRTHHQLGSALPRPAERLSVLRRPCAHGNFFPAPEAILTSDWWAPAASTTLVTPPKGCPPVIPGPRSASTGSSKWTQWAQYLTDMMNEFLATREGDSQPDHIDPDRLGSVVRPPGRISGRLYHLAQPTTAPARANLARTRQDGRTGGNQLFYLACREPLLRRPPWPSSGAAGQWGRKGWQWARGSFPIEKPFGPRFLAAAKALNASILKTLQEHQIYRWTIFLAKRRPEHLCRGRPFQTACSSRWWKSQHIDPTSNQTPLETVLISLSTNLIQSTVQRSRTFSEVGS